VETHRRVLVEHIPPLYTGVRDTLHDEPPRAARLEGSAGAHQHIPLSVQRQQQSLLTPRPASPVPNPHSEPEKAAESHHHCPDQCNADYHDADAVVVDDDDDDDEANASHRSH